MCRPKSSCRCHKIEKREAKNSEKSGKCHVFVRNVRNLRKKRRLDADPIYIPEKIYRTLTRSHMLAGDVLVGIVGTIGSVGLVTKRHGNLTGNCKLAIIRAHTLAPEYIAAYLGSRIGQNEIQRQIRGAVQMGCQTAPIAAEEDVREVLEELCEEIFVAQLAGWFRDEETWPPLTDWGRPSGTVQ